MTVRALDVYRDRADPTADVNAQQVAAVRRTAACVEAFTLRHTGYALTPSCVMAALEPVDERPELLRRRLGSELGPLGSLEDGVARDIWYSTVLHFAAPIADPEGLVSWVADRRRIVATTVAIDSVSLVRFRYTEVGGRRWMQPDEWQRSALRPA